jgi:hypothetical protein
MLTLPSSVRVYVATMPTDMRKSFDGLSVAAQALGQSRRAGIYLSSGIAWQPSKNPPGIARIRHLCQKLARAHFTLVTWPSANEVTLDAAGSR